jgi:hypothetical protein
MSTEATPSRSPVESHRDPLLVSRFFRAAGTALAAHRADFGERVGRTLCELREKLAAAREEIRRNELLHATRFNVFGYIRPDENRLSDILADLLDPHGTHGQGDAFLRLFGTELGVELPDDLTGTTVTREEPTTLLTNPLRRIDVVIDFGPSGLAIENKPWAGEQVDQVKDYLDQLRRRYGERFVLVYLTGDGSPPPSVPPDALSRLEREGRFRLLPFPTGFSAWLDACADRCRAEPVRGFLRQFRQYVRDEFRLAVNEWKAVDA